MKLLCSTVSLSLLIRANAHGSLVNPPPRNAIDRSLPWGARTPEEPCFCANTTAGAAGPNSTDGCDAAQACYWYSQGCFIGCPTCDSISGRKQVDLCGAGKVATLNEPSLRTVNRAAKAQSELDIYKHNPWRAPGSAAVMDACGLAGGTPWGQNVSEWGNYVQTQFAKHGDFGSRVLPPMPSATVWAAGGEGEVVFQITANHGGGFAYRLCPADQPITEACFMATHLEFVRGSQTLLFSNGTRLPVPNPVYVSEGTIPPNSTWAMNPIPPRCLGRDCSRDNVCHPCDGLEDCTTCDNTPDPSFEPPCDEMGKEGLCSGNQPSTWGSVSVLDRVKIPRDLKPGKYVLGWRLDCEATAQVWSNCADVTVVPPN